MINILEIPILSYLILIPIIGIGLNLLFIRGSQDFAANTSRKITLFIMTINFLLSVILLFYFDGSFSGFQFVEFHEWIKDYNINYHLAIDGISIFFILLTTFLMPLSILASGGSKTHSRNFYICFLLLESLIIGAFSAIDLILFYLFFEAVLIPMFFIIGIWGGYERVYAAFKFFLYTLFGSVLFLAAIIYIYSQFHTSNIIVLLDAVPSLPLTIQKYLWLGFFISFAIKVPMWPVHTWLPDAHVEAPTAGSMILAGVLIKMGAYGFLRFSLPLLPDASIYYKEFIYIISAVAVIYTSLVALRQTDMKKMIAYSSIAHMGFVTAGIFALNIESVEGAIMQMISHGLVSAALFLYVGFIYDRTHTKEIAKFGGIVNSMPIYAGIFMFFTLASVGLPGTSSFVGEFLVMLGLFKDSYLFAFLLSSAMVLGAVYMLFLYKRVIFGEIQNKEISTLGDLNRREFAISVPIVIMVITLGIYPILTLSKMEASVKNLIVQVTSKLGGKND